MRTTTSEMKKIYYEWEEKFKSDKTQIFGVPARCDTNSYIKEEFAFQLVENITLYIIFFHITQF